MKTTTTVACWIAVLGTLSACPCTSAVCEKWESAPFDADLRVFTSSVAAGLGGKIAVRDPYAVFPGFETRSSGVSQELLSIAADENYANCPFVAVGRMGSIVVSLNAGKGWAPQSLASVSSNLNGVAVSCENQIGIAVGDAGTILLSHFEGDFWTDVVAGTAANIRAVAFGAGVEALAVGELGTMLLTSNGGESWDPVASGTSEDLLTVAFEPVSGSWFVGGTAGRLLSVTPGKMPVLLQTNVSDPLRQISPRGDGTIRVLGERRLFVWDVSKGALLMDHELSDELYAFVTFGARGGLQDSLWILAKGGKFLYYNDPSVCMCEGRY